ncbi:MAG: 4-hydroxyphenylacetate 3-hydroxylase N-terminal domain-containing protein, partial [Candidatus Binatia bacterium]
MGARSGADYLDSLRALDPEIWIGGERVGDVTTHPALARCAHSVASLYDMQLADPEAMTWLTPGDGRAGLSFIQPATAEDVRRRSLMMKRWAEVSGGMLGRTPDYLNSSLAAMAAARDFFAENDPRFGDNIVRYYEEARRRDWCATHTLVNPRASRAAGWAGVSDENLALQLVRETSEGIVVRGCRMLATLAPQSEELLVFPSTVLKADPSSRPFALAFAIPCNAPGLRFLCRDPFDAGRSHFDHPLASRFEEMDAVVIFEDVLVPWERVFL